MAQETSPLGAVLTGGGAMPSTCSCFSYMQSVLVSEVQWGASASPHVLGFFP